MRTVLTAILVAALAAITAFSVAVPDYYYTRSGRFEPLPVLTAVLWVVFALAFLALRGVRGRAVTVLVLAGSIVVGGAAMAGPPNTSTDSARYAWDGIVQNAGISPYDHTPADSELSGLRTDWLFPPAVDGGTDCTGERIMTTRDSETGEILCTAINRPTVNTIYPPASELYFAAARLFTGPDPQYWPLQLAGLLISVGVTALLLRALTSRGRDPRWAALWGWCPLVATEGVTNSHVDLVAALLLLVASLLIASRRPWLGGIALGVSISTKLIPVIGSFALLRRNPVKVIVGAVAAFALLYVPYVLASGIGVLGYLPGYLSEEGYVSGDRFVLVSLIAPGPAALIVAALLVAGVAALVWARTDPDDPWLGQLIMIGTTLLIVSPRYPWYALLLVPMIAMTGRWEWMTVPLALTARLLFPSVEVSRVAIAVAVLVIVVVSLRRAGPGALGRWARAARHPFRPALGRLTPEKVTER